MKNTIITQMFLKNISKIIVDNSSVIAELNDPDYDFVYMTQELHDALLEYFACNYPIPEKVWTPEILHAIDFLMIPYQKLVNDYIMFGPIDKLEMIGSYEILLNKINFTLFDIPKNKWCDLASQFGNLEILRCAHSNGYDWTTETCQKAAEFGQLDCLIYLHENGCPWDYMTCSLAASENHLNCLMYAHQNNCPWDYFTFYSAVASENLDIVKYVHLNGCDSKDICEFVASIGNLKILKYLHKNGFGWTTKTCSNAAKFGSLKILKYAHRNGCPWDEWTCTNAINNGNLKILKYAYRKGCPLPNCIFYTKKTAFLHEYDSKGYARTHEIKSIKDPSLAIADDPKIIDYLDSVCSCCDIKN